MRYWRIRIGYPKEPDLFVLTARKRGYIAIGWNDLGDLSRFKDEDELKRHYEKVYEKLLTAPTEVRTLWDFAREINIGDIVLLPHCEERVEKVVYVGKISGPYIHRKDWGGPCDFANRMRVDWFKEIEWEDLLEDLHKVLITPATLVNLDGYTPEIEFLLISKGH